jgi:hypothetical protein
VSVDPQGGMPMKKTLLLGVALAAIALSACSRCLQKQLFALGKLRALNPSRKMSGRKSEDRRCGGGAHLNLKRSVNADPAVFLRQTKLKTNVHTGFIAFRMFRA